MDIRSLRTAALAALAAAGLSGCSYLSDVAGLGKSAPDEFAVLTKAPLVIPPDYNLRPPRPGVVPANQVEPTEAAETALFGSSTASNTSASTSEGEKILLASAKADNADSAIRQHLASDHAKMIGTDDSFASEVLFWQKPKPDTGAPLDADQEARRLDAKKVGQSPAGAPPQSQPNPPPQEDKGWFDGWFDWF